MLRKNTAITCTLEPRSLKMISTSKILPNCCKKTNKKGNAERLIFKSLDIFSLSSIQQKFLNPKVFSFTFLLTQMSCKTLGVHKLLIFVIFEILPTSNIVLLTPNICLRSGSLNLKGMLETWSLLGWALLSVLSDTVCVGGWLSVWAASSVCWKTQRTQMKDTQSHFQQLWMQFYRICDILWHKTMNFAWKQKLVMCGGVKSYDLLINLDVCF